jgi:peptide-methionine (S)-S-oxide reductase
MQAHSPDVHRRALRAASPALGRFLGLLGIAVFFCLSNLAAAEPATPLSPTLGVVPQPAGNKSERTVFAGGCFWGVQAVFQHTLGVTRAVSGYAGGTKASPSYEQVSSGRTGHAESVEITFDPSQISFRRLLQIYFSVAHDPTQLNRQDPDEGTQYRSEIFATSDAQQREAEAIYPAEPYHQNYATLHPDSLYIAVYDLPKIVNLKKLYPESYRAQPVLVDGGQQ